MVVAVIMNWVRVDGRASHATKFDRLLRAAAVPASSAAARSRFLSEQGHETHVAIRIIGSVPRPLVATGLAAMTAGDSIAVGQTSLGAFKRALVEPGLDGADLAACDG